MRFGETLEQEAARRKAEAELPVRIADGVARLDKLCAQVRHMTAALQHNKMPNMGGEKSGTLPQQVMPAYGCRSNGSA